MPVSGLHLGPCLDLLRSLPDASVDAVVTDPPYGLGRPPPPREVLAAWLAGEEYRPRGGGFMGQEWDSFVPGPETWSECYRVLRPGGHLVAFGGTRTIDWMALAVRLGGFEVRDMIGWTYFSGFPKSLDVSKAIDAAAGAEREVVGITTRRVGPIGTRRVDGLNGSSTFRENPDNPGNLLTAPATPDARRWSGWGTALKPSVEPAVLARKPLDGTVAQTVLRHGTGALNIDGCRFAPGDGAWVGPDDGEAPSNHGEGGTSTPTSFALGGRAPLQTAGQLLGRWPANLYACAKASRAERERGCDGLPARSGAEAVQREEGSAGAQSPSAEAGRVAAEVRNAHPTVKPVRLMRWLCRLVCPPGGLVLDPFTGSGTTGVAAALEGFRFAGAELSEDYHRIAAARIDHARRYPESWGDTAPGTDTEANTDREQVERLGQVGLFGSAR